MNQRKIVMAVSFSLILLLGGGGAAVFTQKARAHPFRWPYNQTTDIEFNVQDIERARPLVTIRGLFCGQRGCGRLGCA